MNRKHLRIDRAPSLARPRLDVRLAGERLEMRELLAANLLASDALPQADWLEGEAVLPTVAAEAGRVSRQSGAAAANQGTYAGSDVTLSASLGEVIDNGDGTWSWSFDTRQTNVGAYQVAIIAQDALGNEATTEFLLTVHNYALQPFDMRPGDLSSAPENLIKVGDVIYFVAETGTYGRQLMKSDGRGAPEFVLDVEASVYPNSPLYLVSDGNEIFFLGRDSSGYDLWGVDLATEQARKVAEMPWGYVPSTRNPGYLAYAGGYLYFNENQASTGVELWKANVATGEVSMVADVVPGPSSSSVRDMFAIGDVLYFRTGSNSGKLWRSDGSAAGTYAVESNPGEYVSRWYAYHGKIFFTVNDGATNSLWRIDEAGVSQVLSSPADDSGADLYVQGDQLLLTIWRSGINSEVWRWNESTDEMELVANLADLGFTLTGTLAAYDGLIYFRENVRTSHGFDNYLWRTDGTPSGTVRLAGVDQLADFAFLNFYPTEFGLFLVVEDAVNGEQIWTTDGTPEGTFATTDFQPKYPNTTLLQGFAATADHLALSLIYAAEYGSEFHSLQRGPTVEIGAYYGSRGDVVQLDASGTLDDTDALNDLTFEWDLNGDGAYDDATGPTPTLQLTVGADVPIALRVTDLEGATTYAVGAVINDNQPPTIAADETEVAFQTGTLASNSGTYADVEGYPLSLAASVGTIVDNNDGTWSWSFDTRFTNVGSQEVTITVTDYDGAQTSTTFALVVHNQFGAQLAPNIDIGGPYFGNLGTSLQLNAGGTTDDNDLFASLLFGWDLDGDGSFDDASGPSPTLSLDVPGLRSIGLQVTDLEGASSYAATTLLVNAPPTIDVDNEATTVDEGSVAVNSGVYADSDDVVVLTASVGAIVDHQDGTWSWTFATQNGPDQSQTVVITATDSGGLTVQSTFALTVNNLAPQIAAASDYLIAPVGEVAVNDGTFGDLGEDVVTLTASAGTVVDNGDGTWSWSMDDAVAEIPASVTITADDGAAQATTTFTVFRWNPQATPLGSAEPFAVGAPITEYVRVGNLYFFVSGESLWRTDGTTAGTINLMPNMPPSIVKRLFNYQGTLVFSAQGSLWKSDGTVAGTTRVSYTRVNDESDAPVSFFDVHGTLIFVGTDGLHGYELWTSDLTEQGTQMLVDVNQDSSSSLGLFEAFQASNGDLYFIARSSATGNELWTTDGTVAGTHLVKDIYVGGDGVRNGTEFAELNGEIYFTAQTADSSNRLWKTDGTEGGTQLVTDNPNEYHSFDSRFVSDGQFLYYRGGNFYYELLRTDGTPAGTTAIPLYLPNQVRVSTLLTFFQGNLYFLAYDSQAAKLQLWRTDPYLSVVLLADAGPETSLIDYLVAGDYLYFRGYDSTFGAELWRTDGTLANTERLTDISPGVAESWYESDAVIDFALLGNRITTRLYNVNDLPEILDTWFIEVADAAAEVDQIPASIYEGQAANASGTYQNLIPGIVHAAASIGTAIAYQDGTWSWSYVANDNPLPTQTVQIWLSDGGSTVEASFTLNVANIPPSLGVSAGAVTQEISRTATNSGYYLDPGNDPLAFSASLGTVSDLGGSWKWEYTPTSSADIGMHTVTITADDGGGGVTHKSFTLNVTSVLQASLTISSDDATTDAQGETDLLPESLPRIDEWDWFTVNVWIRQSDSALADLTGVALDLDYQSGWFRLDSFAAGSGVGALNVHDVGDVLEISASQIAAAGAGRSGYLLIGSFRFRPNPDGGLANDLDGDYPGGVDPQFSLSDVRGLTSDDVDQLALVNGTPATELQVMPYDLDDDGAITLLDLTRLIRKLSQAVAEDPTAYKYDFDRDGLVTLIDMTYLIRNIGASARIDSPVQLPQAPPESESPLVAATSFSLLEGEAIVPSDPDAALRDKAEAIDAENVDAAFGNLDALTESWELPTDDEAEDAIRRAISQTAIWQPQQLPDWALQASVACDSILEKGIFLLDELAEESPPQLDRGTRWRKSRLNDR